MTTRNHGNHSTSWKLEGNEARLSAGSIAASVDLTHPSRGLHNLAIQGRNLAWQLLGVDVIPADQAATVANATWQPVDAYVRGEDLVATYREPLGQPFNLQIYWRVVHDERSDQVLVEMIVSIQTPLWEAYPCVAVRSEAPAGKVSLVDDVLRFDAEDQLRYVEFPYPGDFDPASEGAPIAANFHWTFGPQFMERGVIRRLRLRGAFTPIAEAEDAVEQMRRDLLVEPPPLTT